MWTRSGTLTRSYSRTKTIERKPGRHLDRTRVDSRPAFPSTLLQDLGLAVAMYASLLLVYWPCLRGGRIWDDDLNITPPSLQSLHGLWRIWFEPGASSQYYPLYHSSLWIEHRLWSESFLGYHLVNITEHALAALLLVFIVRRLAMPGAWLAGLLWALHPICVESVAWITEQKNTLSAVFYMAAALTYLYFDRSRRKPQYLLASGFFLLALLSKTATVTLPAALLVVLWWQRGRIDARRDFVPLLPWLVIGGGFSLITPWVEQAFVGAGKSYDLTPLQHILVAGRIPFFYASKIVWPAGLMFPYPRWVIDPAVWWQYLYPLALLVMIAAFAAYAWRSTRREQRAPLAGLLYFVGTLVPVLAFIHGYFFRFSWVANHLQYLASLGLIVPAACLVTQGAERVSHKKYAGITAGVVLLILLSVVTRQQASLYRSAGTLFRATIALDPENWLGHYNLGGFLSQDPAHLADAIQEFRTALRLKPDYARAHNSLGMLLMQEGSNRDAAIAEFRAAIQEDPDYPLAHNNLGWALALNPQTLNEAVSEFRTALQLQPTYAKAHMNLGNAYAQMPGRLSDAIAEYQAALKLVPDYPPVYKNLGMAYMQTPGRQLDAVAVYQAGIERFPADAQMHLLLGNALAQMPDRQQDAIVQYQMVIQLVPDSAYAENARQAIARLQASKADSPGGPAH